MASPLLSFECAYTNLKGFTSLVQKAQTNFKTKQENQRGKLHPYQWVAIIYVGNLNG